MADERSGRVDASATDKTQVHSNFSWQTCTGFSACFLGETQLHCTSLATEMALQNVVCLTRLTACALHLRCASQIPITREYMQYLWCYTNVLYAIPVQSCSNSHLERCQAESAQRGCLLFAADSIRSAHTVFSLERALSADKGLVFVHVF